METKVSMRQQARDYENEYFNLPMAFEDGYNEAIKIYQAVNPGITVFVGHKHGGCGSTKPHFPHVTGHYHPDRYEDICPGLVGDSVQFETEFYKGDIHTPAVFYWRKLS
jgi:hypothetical protein